MISGDDHFYTTIVLLLKIKNHDDDVRVCWGLYQTVQLQNKV